MTEISDQLSEARDRLRDQAASSPNYLTVPEVAELARCEHKAVRKAVHDGLLPAFSPSRKLLIRESDAVQWVESRPVRIGQRPPAPRPSRPRREPPGSVKQLREMQREMTR
jgi:excisionase family DNA binding protein